jgi:hypothetical protein
MAAGQPRQRRIDDCMVRIAAAGCYCPSGELVPIPAVILIDHFTGESLAGETAYEKLPELLNRIEEAATDVICG